MGAQVAAKGRQRRTCATLMRCSASAREVDTAASARFAAHTPRPGGVPWPHTLASPSAALPSPHGTWRPALLVPRAEVVHQAAANGRERWQQACPAFRWNMQVLEADWSPSLGSAAQATMASPDARQQHSQLRQRRQRR